MKKKYVKLHNIIFPIWMLFWILPIFWIVVLPANFLIDLLVIILTMRYMNIQDIRQKAKAVILKVWIFGFAADFIGSLGMLLAMIITFDFKTPFGNWWYYNITSGVAINPFDNIFSFVWVTLCIIAAAYFIYIFNCKICLKNIDISDSEKKRIALSLAIFTAPYLLYLPTKLFY